MNEQDVRLNPEELAVLFPGHHELPPELPHVTIDNHLGSLAINDGVNPAYDTLGVHYHLTNRMLEQPTAGLQKAVSEIGTAILKKMTPTNIEATGSHTVIPGIHPSKQLAALKAQA